MTDSKPKPSTDLPRVAPHFYDRTGSPMTLADWATASAHVEYRVVRAEQKFDYSISTIWVGLDLSHGMCRKLIFETAVFNGEAGIFEVYDRYRSEKEAIAGHEAAVDCVRLMYEGLDS